MKKFTKKRSHFSKNWHYIYRQIANKTVSRYNNPQFRLVNSNNQVRGEAIKTGNKGNTKHGTNNGAKGHKYFAAIKPNSWQTGTDNYTFTFSAE